jgi:hypothetical protein
MLCRLSYSSALKDEERLVLEMEIGRHLIPWMIITIVADFVV